MARLFNYTQYQPVEYIGQPVNEIKQSLAQIQERHDAAMDTSSALAAKLAELPLNEAEDQWRANYAAKMQEEFTNATTFGNAATAFDTVRKQARDFASNPELLGRLRYNQQREEFLNNLENRNDISQAIKNYTRENTPYAYEDNFDENGNVIGGSKFDPNYRPVSQIAVADIFANALKTVAAESGGGDSIYFLDANGRYTTDQTRSVDGLPYMKQGVKYERLSQDKIKEAFYAQLNATPGANESITQDWTVGTYNTLKSQDEEGNVIPNEFTDDQGILLTRDQYIESLIDPLARTSAFNRVISSSDPLAGFSVAAQNARNSSKKSDDFKPELTSYIGGVITDRVNNYGEMYKSAQDYTVLQKQLATSYGLKIDDSMDNRTLLDLTVEEIKNARVTEEKRQADLEQAYRISRLQEEAQLQYNNFVQDLSEDDRSALDFTMALNSGGNIDDLVKSNNKYATAYIQAINNTFGENGKYLQVPVKNLDDYNKILEILDGGIKGSHTGLGITTGSYDNVRKYIRLDRDSALNLYTFLNAIEEVDSDIGWFRSLISERGNRANAIEVIDEDGKSAFATTRVRNSNNIKRTIENATNYKKTKAITENILTKNEYERNTTFTVYPISDFAESEARRDGESKQIQEKIAKDVRQAVRSADFAQTRMFEATGGTYREIRNSKSRRDTGIDIAAIMAKYPDRVTIGWTSVHGQSSTFISIAESATKSDNDLFPNGYSVIIPNLVNSESQRKFENYPNVRAQLQLDRISYNGEGIIPLSVEGVSNILGNAKLEYKNGSYTISTNLADPYSTSKEGALLVVKAAENFKNAIDIYRTGALDNYEKLDEVSEEIGGYIATMLGYYNVDLKTLPDSIQGTILAIIDEL